jgi:hypothetical protein
MTENSKKFYDSPIMIIWAILTVVMGLLIVYLSSINIISLNTSNLIMPIFVIIAFLIGYSIWRLQGKMKGKNITNHIS